MSANGTLESPPQGDRPPITDTTDSAVTGASAAGADGRPSALFLRSDLAPDRLGQFGEVAILADLVNYYGAANHWMVDVGCHDGLLFSNSAAFRENGWKVIGIDKSSECLGKAEKLEPQMFCRICSEVTPSGPHTLDWLLGGLAGPDDGQPIPSDFDILSIDIDGYDYHIWESLEKFRPRFVCIEINDFGSFFWDGEYVPEYGKPLEVVQTQYGPHDKRTTTLSMAKLAKSKGYTPVALTRTNAIFVRDDVVASKPLKLNVGSQGTFLCGFVMVDKLTGDEAFPLPYADNSVDEVYASHVLEHFPYTHTVDVLKDWARVLKADGKIRIAVPDFEKIIDPKVVGDFTQRTRYLFGGLMDKHDRHGALFTQQSLAAQMRHVGFECIQPWESEIEDCASLPISLNLGGLRRRFLAKKNPVTVAVISQPRLIFADASNCLHRGLRAIANKAVYLGESKPPLLDDLIFSGGAFWEKSLTAGIKTALAIGADRILFVDYDSLFSPDDVLNLDKILDEDLDASGVFSVQASRHHDAALVQMEYIKYEGAKTQVTLGHFGLTMIRAEVFRDLPHPWLWSMPHPDTGQWDTAGHCDADITFWRILHEHGHKVVQANHVQAGHLVLCAKWMTEKGVAYQPIEHYRAFGRPKQAVFNAEALYKNQNERIKLRIEEAEHAMAQLNGQAP